MSADLYLHERSQLSEDQLRCFSSNVIGSPNSGASCVCGAMGFHKDGRYFDDYHDEKHCYNRVADTGHAWIGEVSWLKAGFAEDYDTYVPGTVERVAELVPYHRFTVLTEDLRDRILEAFDLENTTSYTLAKKEKVGDWLERHLSKQIFSVSW